MNRLREPVLVMTAARRTLRTCAPAIATLLLAAGVSASAQVRTPVAGSFALTHAISGGEADRLAREFQRRQPSSALVLDPGHLHDLAGAQAAPVEVNGSHVVPASPHSIPAERPTAPAKIEIIRTNDKDETLLRQAIAGHSALRPALSGPESRLITLPGLVRMPQAEGSPLQLKPFIVVSQPLERDSSGQFAGELLIGVSEISDTDEVRQLPAPLLFEIAGAARSYPDRILVETTSPPFQRVKVWLSSARGAGKFLILSVLDKAGIPISVPVASELAVETASAGIEGWGLETTRVELTRSNMGADADRRVRLHVEPSGYLDKSAVTLDQDGGGEAELRSDGIGTAHIEATSSDLPPATADVTYRFPARTLGASMGGGLLGALVSLMTDRRRGKRPAARLIGSALFGALVFAFYVVGMNILPLQPKVTVGGAFVFAVSALAAWLGPSIPAWKRKLPAA